MPGDCQTAWNCDTPVGERILSLERYGKVFVSIAVYKHPSASEFRIERFVAYISWQVRDEIMGQFFNQPGWQ